MSLLDIAREDIEDITTDIDDFGIVMHFVNEDGSKEADIKGIFARHHIDVNRNGVAFNSRQAHVSVSELEFDNADYPIRNSDGEVTLSKHKVTVEGITYIINQWFPSDTTKLITLILGKYAS